MPVHRTGCKLVKSKYNHENQHQSADFGETQKFLPWWFDIDPTTNPFMRDHKLRYHVVHYKESETESSLPGN